MTKPGLAEKITVTLIIIAVLAAFLTTLFMLLITKQEFSDYIHRYDQATLDQMLPIISEYYAQNGAAGLQEYLILNTPGKMSNNVAGKRRGAFAGTRIMQGQRLVVADMNGIIVADTQEAFIGQRADLAASTASSGSLTAGGQQLGTLYVLSSLGSGLVSLENDFVDNLTRSALFLAILLGLIALLTGLFLGKRISAPLGEISRAIHQVAQGKLNQRMKPRGDQEFVKLSQDFNFMAQRLEEADQNRRRLTADLSHELRTPLTFLRGQLEGMQKGTIPLNGENVTLLLDEVIRLSRLVKELDDLAMVENRVVALNITTFEVTELLDRLMPVNITMQDQGINFEIDIDESIEKITADRDRLLQILLNLLSNTLRHVDLTGSVKLSIHNQRGQLLFSVADNGAGISEKDLPYVFERFYRVDDSRNRREGGMGLGLAIAKGYTEAHQGEMWVESTEGVGTTFFFTLPKMNQSG